MSTGIYFDYFAFSPEKLLLLFTQKVRKECSTFLRLTEVTFWDLVLLVTKQFFCQLLLLFTKYSSLLLLPALIG